MPKSHKTSARVSKLSVPGRNLKVPITGPTDRPVILGAIVLLICLYYFWIMVPLRMLPQNSYYNMLSDAFRTGQVSLHEKPRPELLALADPYDPKQNGPYRLHDASLYKGKYYLYFGPVPAVVLFLPAQTFLGIRISQDAAVAIFLSGGLIASVLALKFLLHTLSPPAPTWKFLVGVVALGLCNAAPFLLVRPDVYEVAISSGYFFAMSSLAFALYGGFSKPAKWGALAASSLCAGLAVGSRPDYILLSAVLFAGIFNLPTVRRQQNFWNEFLKRSACLLIPFGLCILALLIYNYTRFENPFEFGNHYQLAAIHPKDYPLFRIDLFFNRLGRYLFFPYIFDGEFPFVHLPKGTYFGEPEAGSFLMTPFVILALIWIFALLWKKNRAHWRTSPILLTVIFGLGPAMLLFLPIIANPIIRYHIDYLGFLLLAGLYAWCDLGQRWMPLGNQRRAFDLAVVSLIAFSCWVGVAFGHNLVSPRAISNFYAANALFQQGALDQAANLYERALRVSPAFALAEKNLSFCLAAQGKGDAAADHFTKAMQIFADEHVKFKNRGYMPAFQALCLINPVAEYYSLANTMISNQQTESAIQALSGLSDALAHAGLASEVVPVLKSVQQAAKASNQSYFAIKIDEMIPRYQEKDHDEAQVRSHPPQLP